MKKKLVDVKHIIYSIYIYMLFFTILNRSFKPFGIDTRYIVFVLGGMLLILSVFSKISIRMDYNFKLVLLFYAFVMISIVNQKFFMYDKSIFYNLVILNIYCFFNIVILNIYRDYFNVRLVYTAFKLAIYFLGLSVLLTYVGINLPYNDYLSYTSASEISDIRYCGYGSDPNYVSVIAVCFAIFVFSFGKSKKSKLLDVFFSLTMLALAQSRTVIAVFAIILMIYLLEKLMKNRISKHFDKIIFIVLSIVPIFMVWYRPLGNDVSMAIRYNLWERAWNAFIQHPFLGNGLMSVRTVSYIQSNWFVQCHSTYFQILCEQGIFALMVYLLIYWRNFNTCSSEFFKYCFLMYLAWSFTYETVYLPYTILFMGIFPYCDYFKKVWV